MTSPTFLSPPNKKTPHALVNEVLRNRKKKFDVWGALSSLATANNRAHKQHRSDLGVCGCLWVHVKSHVQVHFTSLYTQVGLHLNRNNMPAQGDIMFLNEDMSDVTFMVGESETTYVRLPAHRFILSVASNVFRRMFTAGFVERDSGTVIIRDITPCIFKQTLK